MFRNNREGEGARGQNESGKRTVEKLKWEDEGGKLDFETDRIDGGKRHWGGSLEKRLLLNYVYDL